MRKLSFLIALVFSGAIFSQTDKSQSFHDTQGNIEVNGSGQLQYTLPIALPPGIKSVAPQINLVYTSGSGNGIAGYGWNLSGITSISRVGKNLDKDGKKAAIGLTYDDVYAFNGQRLILKSGEYGRDGAEYTTEKYSNVRIKSVGSLSGKNWQGPEYWEVSFEDGSQAWYGVGESSNTPVEYNITKWRDAQGNYITYAYTQQNNVAMISRISWGGNKEQGTSHFNEIVFNYSDRELRELSYVSGEQFIQNKILTSVQVNTNGNQFKKYVINYDNGSNGTRYQFVKNITEYNSKDEAANPVTFEYEKSQSSAWTHSYFEDNKDKKLVGDFDGDGKLDFLKYYNAYTECTKRVKKWEEKEDNWLGKVRSEREVCVNYAHYPGGLYLFRGAFDDAKQKRIHINIEGFSKEDFNNSSVISFKDANGVVKGNQGFVIYKKKGKRIEKGEGENKYWIDTNDIELMAYSIENDSLVKHYTKMIPYDAYDGSYGKDSPYMDGANAYTQRWDMMYNSGYTRSYLGGIQSMDLDGDGLSELVISVEDRSCSFIPIRGNDASNRLDLMTNFLEDANNLSEKIVSFETKCYNSYLSSFTRLVTVWVQK